MINRLSSELSIAGNAVVVLTLLLLVGGALPAVDFFSEQAHYLPLHTALESLSLLASASVFLIAWTLRRSEDNSAMLLLGMGLFVVCLIDFGHVLSYQGMPSFITPSSPEKAINFWLAARLAAAVTMLAVALWPTQRLGALTCTLMLAAGMLFAGVVYWVTLFHADVIPRTFIEGQGLTAFKTGAEYALTAMFLLAAVLLFRRRGPDTSVDFVWLAAAAWVQGLAELFFTLYSDVSDIFNLFGHLYKVAAYLMIYRAIVLHWRSRVQLRP
jgi:hypothetical protein